MPAPLPKHAASITAESVDYVTHRQLVSWVVGGAIAFIFGALMFGGQVVAQAKAASEAVERRVESRLERIEGKVDQLLELQREGR